jgi:hypothetical protein
MALQLSRYFVTPARMSSWPLLNKLCCCSWGRLLNFYSSARGQLMVQWSSMHPATSSGRSRQMGGTWNIQRPWLFNALFCNTYNLFLIFVWFRNLKPSTTLAHCQNRIIQTEVKWGYLFYNITPWGLVQMCWLFYANYWTPSLHRKKLKKKYICGPGVPQIRRWFSGPKLLSMKKHLK